MALMECTSSKEVAESIDAWLLENNKKTTA
jgi:hypothetical protein